jgi:hypothetical protein
LNAFDLQLAEVSAGDCSEPKSAAVVEAIDALTGQLAEHFEHEEARGYLPDIYELAPRYSARADRLLAEHEDILSHVHDLAAQVRAAASGSALWPDVVTSFRGVADRLHQHEQEENLLVQRALTEDIGN